MAKIVLTLQLASPGDNKCCTLSKILIPNLSNLAIYIMVVKTFSTGIPRISIGLGRIQAFIRHIIPNSNRAYIMAGGSHFAAAYSLTQPLIPPASPYTSPIITPYTGPALC